MAKIAIRDISANYDEDQKKADNNKVIDLQIDNKENVVFLNIDIDKDDHYLTFQLDLDDFNHAVEKAKKEGMED